MSSRKVRVKKLNTKTPLPVLREDQIDPSEYEALATETQIATGVEQAEENVSVLATWHWISRGLSRDISWHDIYPSNPHLPSVPANQGRCQLAE